MGLGSALSTAVSGLNVNQNAIDVIGNNLANVNTTAFKASRNEFINNFYNTISVGSTPDANTAGKNPVQIGQGSTTDRSRSIFGQGLRRRRALQRPVHSRERILRHPTR